MLSLFPFSPIRFSISLNEQPPKRTTRVKLLLVYATAIIGRHRRESQFAQLD